MPDEILITSGSQQGPGLCAKLFSDRPVAFEDPGYLGARLAFQASRVPLIPVRLNADGPEVDALSHAFETDAAVYYGMSRYQNPTGRTYHNSTADNLAELLNTSDSWMIEVDPYGEIKCDDTGSTLITTRVPDRVIYLGSFSESVAPSLRIGSIRASCSLLQRIEPFKQAADLHTSAFTQGILRELLANGKFSFGEPIARICHFYLEKPDRSTAPAAPSGRGVGDGEHPLTSNGYGETREPSQERRCTRFRQILDLSAPEKQLE